MIMLCHVVFYVVGLVLLPTYRPCMQRCDDLLSCTAGCHAIWFCDDDIVKFVWEILYSIWLAMHVTNVYLSLSVSPFVSASVYWRIYTHV